MNEKGNGCGQWSVTVLQEAAVGSPYRDGQMSDLLVNGNNSRTCKRETPEKGRGKESCTCLIQDTWAYKTSSKARNHHMR